MRIRWKLLIAMLAMILVPILFLRWNAQSSMQEMGDELAATTRKAMVKKAREEMQIIVEEHSTVLQRERELIEMILRVQASELENWLAGNNGNSVEPYRAAQMDTAPSTGPAGPMKRLKMMPGGKGHSFAVFYDRVSYRTGASGHGHSEKYSVEMAPIYRKLANEHPDLVFWQITVFEDGTQSVFPGVELLPMKFEPANTDWYRAARERDGIVWGRPSPDTFTKRFQFTVAKQFQNGEGKLAGVTAIAVPVGELLQNERHFDYVSKRLKVFMVEIEPGMINDRNRIRIIAAPRPQAESMRRWWELRTDEWIEIDDESVLEKIISDVESLQSNVLDTLHEGVDSLIAYSGIDRLGTALVLIAPKEDVMAEALAMEDSVLDSINRQLQLTGIILISVILVVVALAYFLSRSITGDISRLVNASRRIAKGDFNTRAEIQSKDEMGELGRIFDQMVPALKENLKIKQSLDLAMEVQQSLLPSVTPAVAGLDIAATSIYCDETGGDFFDFPDVCCEDSQKVAVAVGDVAGHGVSAALLMATARAFLRCRITLPGQKSEIISDVNSLLTTDTDDTGQFVTLFYAEIDVSQKTMQWIRAGHDPALLYYPHGDHFEELSGQGTALGIDGQFEFGVNNKAELAEGQILCIGTDGIWETRNPQGEMFGRQRMRDIIREKSHLPAEKILSEIIESVREFRAESRQEDDITLVIIKFT